MRKIDILNLRILRKRSNAIEGESYNKNMVYRVWIIESPSRITALAPSDIIETGIEFIGTLGTV